MLIDARTTPALKDARYECEKTWVEGVRFNKGRGAAIIGRWEWQNTEKGGRI